jgi:hypothetical protein
MKPFNKIHSKQIDMGVCPRCEGLIPSNEHHKQYMGAISRLTRDKHSKPIEICSDCGTEEGMQEHFEGFATPIKDWPIMTSNAIKRRSDAFYILMEWQQKIDQLEDDEDGTEEPF